MSDLAADWVEWIVDEVCKRPVEQQEAFLDGACAEDDELRQRVEQLLHEREESGPTATAGLSGGDGEGQATPRRPAAVAETPGTMIGPYQLLQLIGEGGFGEVWIAEQKKPVRRRVAVKIVKAGMDTKEVLGRFEAERQALALMDHPNVAKVFDAGATDRGRPYFVMEHVAGLAITDYCDTGKMRIRDRLKLFMPVYQAVQHAHQKGIIHRDLKPSNILVTLVDGNPVPKVIDFGIAKATTGTLTDRTIYTEIGRLIGTPEYMSPEQAQTTGLDVDTRADIYSLGVILYELLTGTLPFDPKILRSAGHDGMAKIIREMEPPKPSTRLSTLSTEEVNRKEGQTPQEIARRHGTVFAELRKTVRGDLDWIVMKCLEKERSRRYETANSLSMDIGRFLADEPIVARPPSTAYRFRKFARRNRGLLAAGSATAASLVIGLALATWGMFHAVHERNIATDARLVAEDQKRAADLAQDAAMLSQRLAEEAYATADRERQRAEDALTEAEVRGYTATLAAAVADLERNDARSLRRRLAEAPEHLRGWEWEYLWNEADRSVGTPIRLPVQPTGYRLHLSGDGSLVASRKAGAPGGPIQIHDTASGELVTTIEWGGNNPRWIFSPGNLYLAYPHRSTPGVQIFDVSNGSWLVPLPEVDKYHEFLGFDPSGEMAAMLHAGGVKVFRIDSWTEIAEFPGEWPFEPFQSRRSGGAFSPDGRLLVVGTRPPSPLRVFDMESGAIVVEIHEPTMARVVRFSDDGSRLATLAEHGMIRIYDTETWKPVREIESPSGGDIRFVEISGDLMILAAGRDGVVSMHWVNETRHSFALRGHGAPATSIAVDGEREQIVTAHVDGVVKRWDLRHPGKMYDFRRSFAFSRDGSVLHVGGRAKRLTPQQVATVEVLTSRSIGRLHFFPHTMAHVSSAADVAVSPDDRFLAVVTKSSWEYGRLKVFDLWSGLGTGSSEFWADDMHAVAWSPDGRRIATGDDQGRLALYNAPSCALVRAVSAHRAAITDALFAHDTGHLLTASRDGTVRIWNAEDLEPLSVLGTEGDPAVLAITLAPDGLLVAGRQDGSVVVWDRRSNESLIKFDAHGGAVHALAFLSSSEYASRLATGSADRSIKIWDPATWRELVAFRTPTPVTRLAFSPDGTRLAMARGVVQILDARPELERTRQRRSLVEAHRLARPLATQVLEQYGDVLPARERIMADQTLTDIVRRVTLRELTTAAGETVAEAYDFENALAIVLPILHDHFLRGQMRVDQWTDMDASVDRVAGLTDLTAAQRQASLELVRASTFGFNPGILEWRIVREPERKNEDYALAYFGLTPVIEDGTDDFYSLMAFGTAQYRVGLLSDAVATLQRADELDTSGNPYWHSLNLVVRAMCHHRLGLAERAAALMAEFEAEPDRSDAGERAWIKSFRDEARAVLETPATEPPDEDAARESLAALHEELEIGVPTTDRR